MSLPSFCHAAVEVRRPFVRELRGTSVSDWTHATSHMVYGCSMQPVATSSNREARVNNVQYDARLYAPPGADIKAGDRVAMTARGYRGVVFEVDGQPMAYESPSGAVSHQLVLLKRHKG